jgi:hypothetical protein
LYISYRHNGGHVCTSLAGRGALPVVHTITGLLSLPVQHPGLPERAGASRGCGVHERASAKSSSIDASSNNFHGCSWLTACMPDTYFFGPAPEFGRFKMYVGSSCILQECSYKEGEYPDCLPSVVEQIMVSALVRVSLQQWQGRKAKGCCSMSL